MVSGDLIGRKSVLEQALYQLNEFLDGASQQDVVENLRTLYEQERTLLVQREKKELERQQAGLTVAIIDSQLDELRTVLKERSKGKKEELFAVMKQKRWYFFKNNPFWVFDRHTGLLWPNLDYVELFSGKRNEVVSQITLHELGDWSVPSYRDFKLAWEDRSFPFFTANFQVLCRKKWQEEIRFQTEEGFISSVDFSYNTGDYPNCALYPCNRKFETDEFQVDRHNRLYPDGFESERRLLRFFLEQRLFPFFDNEAQQEIFNKFVRRRELMKQYSKLLEESSPLEKDYALPDLIRLCRQDLVELPEKTSVLQFYQLAQTWLDKLHDGIDAYAAEHCPLLQVLHKLFEKTQTFDFSVYPSSGKEQALARQACLNELCSVTLQDLLSDVALLQQDVAQLGESLQSVLASKGVLERLAALEKQDRPSLIFLLDFICDRLEKGLKTIRWRITHFSLMEALFEAQIRLHEYYTVTMPQDQALLTAQCEEQELPVALAEQWGERWRQEIEMIDSRFLSLFRAVEDEIIPDSTAVFLGQKLSQYAAQVRRFYTEFRLQLYLKHAEAADFEKERKEENEQLLKLTGQLTAAVKSASFDLEKAAAKTFLRHWSEPWLKARSGS